MHPPDILNNNSFSVEWHQRYLNADRPLRNYTTNRSYRVGLPFSRLRNLFTPTVFLCFPFLFIRRANPLCITDAESATRFAGPIPAIGAWSCVAVCHTFLEMHFRLVDIYLGGDCSWCLRDDSVSARSARFWTNERVRYV